MTQYYYKNMNQPKMKIAKNHSVAGHVPCAQGYAFA